MKRSAGGSGAKSQKAGVRPCISDNLWLWNADGEEGFIWWTHLDSNQGPLACEASALTGLSYASTGRRIIAPAPSLSKSAASKRGCLIRLRNRCPGGGRGFELMAQ